MICPNIVWSLQHGVILRCNIVVRVATWRTDRSASPEVLLNPVVISRDENVKTLIEGSVNSVRTSTRARAVALRGAECLATSRLTAGCCGCGTVERSAPKLLCPSGCVIGRRMV
jgi:hypothetical protein